MASMASPAPSPSPTPPPAQSSSPAHHQLHSTKPGALVSAAKSTLSEQSARLALKHTTDLDLLDDLRLYLKTRCSIEQNYAQALSKLNSAHSKRSSSLLTFCAAEDEISDVKTVYTSWKIYQEEMEKHAKGRLAVFEQLASACDQLKSTRSHKLHVSKKCLDTHLKKMQEEIINSVTEIDKTRKLYFEEEHLAKQARDKEEKIKKRKTGIFSSFANLQTKKERTSAHREASDIQSTQARNDYIMALAAGNAHLGHYYEQDLPNLMFSIDDAVLDKCRSFILNLLTTEREMITSWHEVIHKSNELMEHSSADHTNAVFLKDPHSASINETLVYEFQPCDNDTIDYISLEHNADIALRNEGQKWFTWFSKECRNLNRLSAQLVRVQAMQLEGHKTVEVSGSGQVDIETRIDEIRQQIRKCEISKIKAKARLQVIRESGAEVEDFESFETQVTMEIKQQSLDVDINLGSLSRTSSMRSNMGSSEAKSPIPIKPESDSADSQIRPESSSSAEQLDSPDREALQLGSSIECTSPAPSSAAYTSAAAGWGMEYDPTQVAWDNEPAAAAAATATYNGYDDQTANTTSSAEYGVPPTESMTEDETNHYDHYAQAATDGFTLVGKQCFVLYAYEGQGEDELSVAEQEVISVIDASDKDWVRAQNQNGQYGYVPAAYLQEMPNQLSGTVTSQPSVVASNSTESESEKISPPEIAVALPEPPVMITTSSVVDPPLPPPPPPIEINEHVEYVRAIYDYEATNSEEISFVAGELIKIVDNSSDDGWWTGESKDGAVGHFPSMLVADLDEEEEEASDDEEDDENEPDLPYLPPIIAAIPPVVSPVIEPPEAEPTEISEPPPGAPTFAPPPKPMTLMTPQTVVIIQPTPEIESKPMIGSEGYDNEEAVALPPETLDDATIEKSSANVQSSIGENAEPESIKVSMCIAAQEVSEAITQNAIDDSMRELSRRTSTASSYDGSVPEVNTDAGVSECDQMTHSMHQPNGDIASNGHQISDHEEDCK